MKILYFLAFMISPCLSQAAMSSAPYKAGEVLIKFKSGVSGLASESMIRRYNSKTLKIFSNIEAAHIKLPSGQNVEEAIKAFESDPSVEFAQPNYLYKAAATVPDDTLYGQLWGLKNTAQTIVSPGGPDTPDSTHNPGSTGLDIAAEDGWDYITDCSSTVVAVLDTGINYSHNDLNANMWNGGVAYPNHGYDFVDSDNDPMDQHGHGTHVAGTIGAVGNNTSGSTGVCWTASIMAVRVLDATGTGTTANIISGLNFAVAQGARVINMSLGTTGNDSLLSAAIDSTLSSNVVLVAAAGNSALNNDGSTPTYPCSYSAANLICVAALDQAYDLADFSNYGVTTVDVGAPGVNIVSSWPGTHATTTDAMTAGWNGAGWGYTTLNGSNVIANPATYDGTSAQYADSASDVFYKTFNLAGADVGVMSYIAVYDTETSNDTFDIYCDTIAADPSAAGTLLQSNSGSASLTSYSHNISSCLSATSTVGFKLTSNASVTNYGIAVSNLSIDTLTWNNTTYNVIEGTSMAAPHVAGVAALVWSNTPSYQYHDIVRAVKTGVSVASLRNKTTTGKAVSLIGALSYLHAPQGVTAAPVD